MDNQSREYGQANFSLPHDVVPLPSQGIFYKNKKKSIKVGYLTATDENLLMAGGDDMTPNLLRTTNFFQQQTVFTNKTQIVTKFNSSCDRTQKLKL